MVKEALSLAAIIGVGWYFWATWDGSSAGPTTRGDIADRRAATDVARCADQYSETAMWGECLAIVAERTGRKADGIARQVNRQEGRRVFALEN